MRVITVALLCRALGLPAPEAEYRFHPRRRWRFDYAWPAYRLAVEIEGGTGFAKVKSVTGRDVIGHHRHPTGYREDCIKYNEALLCGWQVLRATPAMVQDGELGRALQQFFEAHAACVA